MVQNCVLIINISEAKAHVSKLVHLVYQGEEVIISNHNLPLVENHIHKPEKKKTGIAQGEEASLSKIYSPLRIIWIVVFIDNFISFLKEF